MKYCRNNKQDRAWAHNLKDYGHKRNYFVRLTQIYYKTIGDTEISPKSKMEENDICTKTSFDSYKAFLELVIFYCVYEDISNTGP